MVAAAGRVRNPTHHRTRSMHLGHFTWQVVSGGQLKMDGGTMFGVVPRALWSRYAEPDPENLVPMATNCLFVDTGRNRVLIDTGFGSKLTEKRDFTLDEDAVPDG